MITKQCKWYDEDNKTWLGGIFLVDAQGKKWVICGCCGGVQEVGDDVPESKISVFETWIDISADIIGD